MLPQVICHMVTSIDGKVTGDFLYASETQPAAEIYYELHRRYRADAFACGRVTMEGSFTHGWYPDLTPYADVVLPRTDYVGDSEAKFFAVAFDRRGRLGWKTARISDEDPGYDDAHVIEVLCEDVPDAILAYFQEKGISYIFAGEHEMNIQLALEKLYSLFGIEHLLLEGGSVLNGAFARAGLINGLSLVVAPMTAQADGLPLLGDGTLMDYSLRQSKLYHENILWLNYVCKRPQQEHSFFPAD